VGRGRESGIGAAAASGNVLGDAGKPAAGAAVALVPEPSPAEPARFHDALADADGNVNISGVAPGEYRLFAWPEGVGSRAAFDPAFLVRFEEKGVPVVAERASTFTVDLTTVSPLD
jgi:hypothetical protein